MGADYESIRDIAEIIARETGIRGVADFSMVLKGLGGQIERVPFEQWSAPDFFSVEVRGPGSFVLFLPLAETPLDKVLQASALAHYILHSLEGKAPCKFRRSGALQANQEALWFSLSLLLPDSSFAGHENSDFSPENEQALADLFQVPIELIRLKRKIMSAAKR